MTTAHSIKIKGFTLIELIVVIAIVGVLATVLIFVLNPLAQFQKSRDAQRKSDLRQIQAALEFYRAQYGGYPLQGASSCNFPSTCGKSVTWSCTVGANTVTLMQSVPCDPKDNTPYKYTQCGASAGTNVGDMSQYELRTCLEYTSDISKDSPNNTYNPISSCTQPASFTCSTSPSRPSYTVANP